MDTFSMTDMGLLRNSNQDSVFCEENPIGRFPNLFLVADGMGGHKAGDLASRLCIAEMVKQIQEVHMIIELDMSSSTPIYVQLRNQIVKGIGKGELKTGEKLPTVRQLASDAGVNTMTVNKAYQILKNEGFIRTDRRLGAFVSESIADDTDFTEKLESELELLSAEACLTGMSREEFLSMCDKMYSQMKPCTA